MTTTTAPAVTTIRTRYATRPGSNVGAIVATARGGRTHRRTMDQSVSLDDNHRAAAATLADRIGHAGARLEVDPAGARDPRVIVWRVVRTFDSAVSRVVHTFTPHHIGRFTDSRGWEHDAWLCLLRRESATGPVLEVRWRAGIGHNGAAPTAADVLEAYLEDARSAADEPFADWCDTFGYDVDSISALDTYRACETAGRELEAWAGDRIVGQLTAALDAAREAGER